ncbi:MAG: Unknown protein [uncultured Campylobacterales bacterium]|uniref:Uncharacterized protein n=1 Tax=uncultured Campylobacterales bacterium TaxID=352960 RepID=A0A6S6TDF4_9BACT|nr:MAG: Unknown protein [uncultured Campylobacterales bacterium]
MLNKICLGILLIVLLNGCGLRTGVKSCGILSDIDSVEQQRNFLVESGRSSLTPYQMKIKPIVGSRQDDSKVVVDMGKVLKIWVAPYKSGATMISSHDLYTWVQKPGFIPGESIDTVKKADGMMAASKRLPFVFNENEVAKEGDLNSKEVKDYVNSVYKVQNDNEIIKENNKKASKYDPSIKQYLEKQRK